MDNFTISSQPSNSPSPGGHPSAAAVVLGFDGLQTTTNCSSNGVCANSNTGESNVKLTDSSTCFTVDHSLLLSPAKWTEGDTGAREQSENPAVSRNNCSEDTNTVSGNAGSPVAGLEAELNILVNSVVTLTQQLQQQQPSYTPRKCPNPAGGAVSGRELQLTNGQIEAEIGGLQEAGANGAWQNTEVNPFAMQRQSSSQEEPLVGQRKPGIQAPVFTSLSDAPPPIASADESHSVTPRNKVFAAPCVTPQTALNCQMAGLNMSDRLLHAAETCSVSKNLDLNHDFSGGVVQDVDNFSASLDELLDTPQKNSFDYAYLDGVVPFIGGTSFRKEHASANGTHELQDNLGLVNGTVLHKGECFQEPEGIVNQEPVAENPTGNEGQSVNSTLLEPSALVPVDTNCDDGKLSDFSETSGVDLCLPGDDFRNIMHALDGCESSKRSPETTLSLQPFSSQESGLAEEVNTSMPTLTPERSFSKDFVSVPTLTSSVEKRPMPELTPIRDGGSIRLEPDKSAAISNFQPAVQLNLHGVPSDENLSETVTRKKLSQPSQCNEVVQCEEESGESGGRNEAPNTQSNSSPSSSEVSSVSSAFRTQQPEPVFGEGSESSNQSWYNSEFSDLKVNREVETYHKKLDRKSIDLSRKLDDIIANITRNWSIQEEAGRKPSHASQRCASTAGLNVSSQLSRQNQPQGVEQCEGETSFKPTRATISCDEDSSETKNQAMSWHHAKDDSDVDDFLELLKSQGDASEGNHANPRHVKTEEVLLDAVDEDLSGEKGKVSRNSKIADSEMDTLNGVQSDDTSSDGSASESSESENPEPSKDQLDRSRNNMGVSTRENSCGTVVGAFKSLERKPYVQIKTKDVDVDGLNKTEPPKPKDSKSSREDLAETLKHEQERAHMSTSSTSDRSEFVSELQASVHSDIHSLSSVSSDHPTQEYEESLVEDAGQTCADSRCGVMRINSRELASTTDCPTSSAAPVTTKDYFGVDLNASGDSGLSTTSGESTLEYEDLQMDNENQTMIGGIDAKETDSPETTDRPKRSRTADTSCDASGSVKQNRTACVKSEMPNDPNALSVVLDSDSLFDEFLKELEGEYPDGSFSASRSLQHRSKPKGKTKLVACDGRKSCQTDPSRPNLDSPCDRRCESGLQRQKKKPGVRKSNEFQKCATSSQTPVFGEILQSPQPSLKVTIDLRSIGYTPPTGPSVNNADLRTTPKSRPCKKASRKYGARKLNQNLANTKPSDVQRSDHSMPQREFQSSPSNIPQIQRKTVISEWLSAETKSNFPPCTKPRTDVLSPSTEPVTPFHTPRPEKRTLDDSSRHWTVHHSGGLKLKFSSTPKSSPVVPSRTCSPYIPLSATKREFCSPTSDLEDVPSKRRRKLTYQPGTLRW